MKGAISLAAACTLAGLTAGAAIYDVSDVAGLTNAIDKAVNGDTIRLAAGRYDLSALRPFKSGNNVWGTMSAPDNAGYACLWFNKSIRLAGADARSWLEKDAAEESVLDGGGIATIVYVYTGTGRGASFYNLVFANGNAAQQPGTSAAKTYGYGGGIYAMGPATGAITNCVFRNCQAVRGGGVFSYSVRQSLFESCTATEQGGGAYGDGNFNYSTSSTNQFEVCVFRDCRAVYGGGLYVQEMRALEGASAGYVADSTFSNCTATAAGGAIYENIAGLVRGCRFEGNVSPLGALAVQNRMNSQVTNCVFVANASTTDGGGLNNVGLVVNSTFTGNIATNSSGAAASTGEIRGCVFEENGSWAKAGVGGGAVHEGLMRDCTFHGNWTAGQGGAVYAGTVSNCVFEANSSTNQGGACAYVTALDCTFRGNRSTRQRGGATFQGTSRGCRYESNTCFSTARGGFCAFTHCRDCSFTGVGDVSCGSFDHCTFERVVQDGNDRPWLFDCVRNSGGGIGVTNCLIHHCEIRRLVYAEGQTASIVNCTFADNIIPDNGHVLYGDQGTDYQKNAAGTGYRYYPSTVVVENCLFAGNRWQTKGNADLAVRAYAAETDFGLCAMTLRNCVYEDVLQMSGTERIVLENLKKGAARFIAGDTRYPDLPYYALRYGSAARNAGLNAAWMTSATDLAGNTRIADGVVDAGCYECSLPNDGTLFLVR